MRHFTHLVLRTTLAVGLIALSMPLASHAAFDSTEQKCRASISKGGSKYAKSALKAITSCQKSRDKDGSLAATNCDNIESTPTASKVADAATKYDGAASKCTGAPADVLYDSCPEPCNGVVPAIATFANVIDCETCLTNAYTEGFADVAFGSPTSPLTSDADIACHSAITKNGSKLFNTAIKTVLKCEKANEKGGSEDPAACTGTAAYEASVQEAFDKCFAAIDNDKACTDPPSSAIDPASGALTRFDLATNVCDGARGAAQFLSGYFLELEGGSVTTTTLSGPTTSTSTTTITLDTQDPACPDLGKLVIYSKLSNTPCVDNSECVAFAPRDICENNRCVTVADLDSGWTGIGHNQDINDGAVAMANLNCPGNAPAPCGECTVTGLDPTPRNCRCANDIRQVCNHPFDPIDDVDCQTCASGPFRGDACSDNGDCTLVSSCSRRCTNDPTVLCTSSAQCPGGSCPTSTTCSNGTSCSGTCSGTCGAACNCYFGPPFPLSASGVFTCILNRFSQNVSGTADVDAGSGEISASLRTQVYLGLLDREPCPTCGGTCASPAQSCSTNANCTAPNRGTCNSGTCSNGCQFDSDCPGNADCVMDTPDDGNRHGVCIGTGYTKNGTTCDAMASNPSFPARTGVTTPGSGGGLYSLDCPPDLGKNVTGAGLRIVLNQTTGSVSQAFGVDCDGPGAGTEICTCLDCSKDTTQGCASNAECAVQGSFCSGLASSPTYPSPLDCSSNTDCTGYDGGTCSLFCSGVNCFCSRDTGQACSSDAQCQGLNEGPCIPSTCTSFSGGQKPKANACLGSCVPAPGDVGGVEGRCDVAGPDSTYCDGLIRADGTGMKTCNANLDCGSSGNCTLTERRACFLDPIVATGNPDPEFPVAVSTFCIPPTSTSAINTPVGLPGPGRVITQGAATTFCAGNVDNAYTPGAGDCP